MLIKESPFDGFSMRWSSPLCSSSLPYSTLLSSPLLSALLLSFTSPFLSSPPPSPLLPKLFSGIYSNAANRDRDISLVNVALWAWVGLKASARQMD